MRTIHAVPILAVSALLIMAAAPPAASPLSPATRDICLGLGGQSRPVVCKAPASRLDSSEDICLCPDAQRVTAPVCLEGQKPLPENLAFEKARAAAAKDGTLVGDLYQGRPMCVEPRNR